MSSPAGRLPRFVSQADSQRRLAWAPSRSASSSRTRPTGQRSGPLAVEVQAPGRNAVSASLAELKGMTLSNNEGRMLKLTTRPLLIHIGVISLDRHSTCDTHQLFNNRVPSASSCNGFDVVKPMDQDAQHTAGSDDHGLLVALHRV